MNPSFDNRNGWIWLNGSLVPWREANSHIINQGLHYASTVFEEMHIDVKKILLFLISVSFVEQSNGGKDKQ